LQAQDINQAKAIDAEQFQTAKTTLKSIVKDDSSNGAAFFLLGNVYLAQNVADSAAIAYKSGLNAKKEAHLNYIGLGQLDLDNNNVAAAKANFESAKNEMRKDYEEYVYIARAYMNANKPDYKSALATLELAKERKKCDGAASIVGHGDAFYGDKIKIQHFQLTVMLSS
jgi:Tfp pilus assembly protein PilF